ncbi:MAG: DNA-directed RNA polymerase subunit K [Candidatus Nanoarchaeia archaeon]
MDKLTIFEVARIIGARALQIAMGAPVLLKEEVVGLSPLEIAKLEFKKNAIPISIKRPTGEIVRIREAIANWLKDHGGEVY